MKRPRWIPKRPWLCIIGHRWRKNDRVLWLEHCARCNAQRRCKPTVERTVRRRERG